MIPKLRPDDRRAVDLLLDRMSAAVKGNGTALFADGEGLPRHRVHQVEHLLSLLDLIESAEPPADLVSRTLSRIETQCLAPSVCPGFHNVSRPIV